MIAISVDTDFKASHAVKLGDGSSEEPHEHNWKVRAQVSSDKVNKNGFVMDFLQLKAELEDIVSGFGGDRLEDAVDFKGINCTAENVVKVIFEKLETVLPSSVNLDFVRVIEYPGCMAIFSN